MESEVRLAAVSTLARYLPYKNRNDMTSRQYMQYVAEWNTFQRIWIENYTLSTLGSGQRYTFATYDEKQAYLRGQSAHIDIYSSNSPGRMLGTIIVPTNIYAPENQFLTIG
jgi:hypothetical protein